MSTPSRVPHPSETVMQIGTAYFASSCLYAVAQLKIADLLEDSPKTSADLANRSSTNEDILYRVLRALATVGLFVESAPRTFSNTPASEFLRSNHPNSMRDMVLWIADPFHFDTYRDMLPTLRDGKTALEHIHNKAPFDVIFGDPKEAQVFNNAMTTFSAMVIPAVLEVYDFGGIETLADIAGGHGFVLTAILQKYPQMKGVLFDLDHVVEGARKRVQELGLSNRVQVLSGDFFKSVPAADGYVMKHIIHDWDDDRAIQILKNCAVHLKPGGKIILLEAVLPPGNEPHFGKWLDIEMFMLPGGKERSESEFANLFERAGLKLSRIVPTQSPLCVVESKRM